MTLIRQMGYVVLGVPDPLASARDLAEITGVRIVEANADQALLSANDRHCEVAYVRADSSCVLAVGLEAVGSNAVDEIQHRLLQEGVQILDDRALVPGVERSIRFATPMGPILEVHTAAPRRHVGPALMTGGRRVRRLEHVNLRVSDTEGFHEFATKVLGLQLSDRTTKYERAWYRAGDGFHHTIAAGPGSGVHHYAFDAFAIDDLMEVADTLVSKGRSLLWGIGRHGPGNNVFSYYRDPNQCVVEVSWGMSRIDNDAAHSPGNWEFGSASTVLDLWGSQPPRDYADSLTPFAAINSRPA